MCRNDSSKTLGITAMFALLALLASVAHSAAKETPDGGKEVAGDEQPSTTEAKSKVDRSPDDALPIVKVAPIYPAGAMQQRIEGHVLLEFVVTETGSVRDAVVLEAKPSGVFEKSALAAVAKFKYKPKGVDGKAVATPGVRNRIIFELTDD